jgi:hypothetical protein
VWMINWLLEQKLTCHKSLQWKGDKAQQQRSKTAKAHS